MVTMVDCRVYEMSAANYMATCDPSVSVPVGMLWCIVLGLLEVPLAGLVKSIEMMTVC